MTNPVIINASAKHTATLIFLHGLGDTGHGWASAIGAIAPAFCKVICPTAATMPVTLNAGFKMPAWFDLKSLDSSGQDEEGITKATKLVHGMINAEIATGLPANRIVLGGFSQGGALALYATLTFPQPLAGVIGLSCWMPLHETFTLPEKSKVPIFQAHGDCDPVMPYKWGQLTATFLKTVASNVEFKTYRGMMHTASDEEMHDVKLFLEKVYGS